MDANSDSEEISLKDLISNFIKAFHYLKSKWLLILIFGIIGGASGLLYSFFKKPIYTATSTFVLEDNKSNGMGQYSGLASLAGIDIGSSSSNGIFQGDNLLELYKSRLMIQKTLLSSVNVNGKQQLLIDRYIEFNHMREKWKTKPQLAYINFFENPDRFTRQQDSIIQNIVQTFNKKLLVVTKPDKKLSIIQVDVSSKDEIFSKEFNNKLVETVNDFYTQTKTKKSSQNIRVLQKQADSVRNVLNSSLDGVASAIDASPNANPNQLILRVPSQRKQIDVQASTAIYSEIVKNLELAKLSLRQETPLIQLIDQPIIPLENDKKTPIFYVVAFSTAFTILRIVILLFQKLLR